MKVLGRLGARRRLVVGTVVLSVVATGAGLGLFAGAAVAAPVLGQQVLPCDVSGHDICVVPGSANYAISSGTTGAAAPWIIALNDSSTPGAPLWMTGDQIFITVAFHLGTPGGPGGNDLANKRFVEFAQTASIIAQGQGCDSNVPAPTATVTAGTYAGDMSGDAGLTDTLDITFTNSATPGATPASHCALAIVNAANGPSFSLSYTVGANAATPPGFPGLVNVQADYVPTAAVPAQTLANWQVTNVTVPVQEPFGHEQSNASIDNVSVNANNPPVSVLPNAIAAPVSPVNIVETVAAQLSSTAPNNECVELDHTGNTWAGSPTFTVGGGTGGVTNPAVAISTDSVTGKSVLIGSVKDVSVTPETWTFGNLEVNSAGGTQGPQTASVFINATVTPTGATTVTCTGTQVFIQGNQDFGNPLHGNPTVFSIGTFQVNSRIFGSVADQTAVAALETQYPATPHTNCLPNNAPPNASQHDIGSSVVLATDQNWPDALTASYLASYLRTGVLLTPTATLSSYTEAAIAQEGVSSVFIVGGNLAVADSIATQLAGTQQFQCGGTVPRTDSESNPLNLNVTRISGPTADDTAQDVSTFVNSGFVATLNISGVPLYNGFGTNPFNNTSGNDSISDHSPIPTEAVRTAILATDQSFQDAAAISSMSYFEHLPILITPPGSLGAQAQTGLLDLGIQQVIMPGGNIALNNSVASSLESQGIDVVRLAGQDASDTSTQIARFELAGYPGQQSPLQGGTAPSGTNLNKFSDNPAGLGWNYGLCRTRNPQGNVGCNVVVALARGDYFADALTSSVFTGNNIEPILLTEDPNTWVDR